MYQFLVKGKNGKIQSVEIVTAAGMVKKMLNQSIKVRPGDTYMKLVADSISVHESWDECEIVAKAVAPFYEKWGKFGPNGDIISIFRISEHTKMNYYVTSIGSIQYPLPSVCADIVPFVFDKEGNTFFIGIVRGKEPGIGKGALIGGHRDVVDSHYQTPVEALVHESRDEASLLFIPLGDDEEYKTNPDIESVKIMVHLGGMSIMTDLERVGVFQTGEEEIIPHLNERRVHETVVYTCLIEYDGVLTIEELLESLEAGDDASGMYVRQLGKSEVEFGLSHHKEIYDAACDISVIGR